MSISDTTVSNPSQANSPKLVLQQVPSPEQPVDHSSTSSGETGLVYLVSGFFGIAFIIIFLKRLQARKIVKNQFSLHQPFHNIPCMRCQYFNNNLYIKCAVNPSTVLSEQAKDCTDYEPLDSSQ